MERPLSELVRPAHPTDLRLAKLVVASAANIGFGTEILTRRPSTVRDTRLAYVLPAVDHHEDVVLFLRTGHIATARLPVRTADIDPYVSLFRAFDRVVLPLGAQERGETRVMQILAQYAFSGSLRSSLIAAHECEIMEAITHVCETIDTIRAGMQAERERAERLRNRLLGYYTATLSAYLSPRSTDETPLFSPTADGYSPDTLMPAAVGAETSSSQPSAATAASL